MIYKVCLTAKANKVYSEADSVLRKKIAKCLNILQETPKNHPQIKALKGEFAGKYRFRVGDYWDLDKKQIDKSLNSNPRLGFTSRSPKSLKPR